MKKYFLLIFLINFLILSTNAQVGNIQNLKYIKAWHFKNDRNPDFGINLPIEVTEGIFNSELIDNRPSYCCGSESKYSESGELLTHNDATVDQWFQSSIGANDYCNNYEVLIPVNVFYDYNFRFQIEASQYRIQQALKYGGFSNRTEFPEYIEDPDKYLFCWTLEMDLVSTEYIGLVAIEAPGEYWVYLNNSLYTDVGGTRNHNYSSYHYVYEDIPIKSTTKFNIFGCSRSNAVGAIFFSFEYYQPFCDISSCGTCGPANCEGSCVDNSTSCYQTKDACGACVYEPRNCDDEDPCTIDSCLEGTGCEHKLSDPNCYCNENNCQTTDLCNPKTCTDSHTCETTPIVCVGNSTCLEPHCLNGECICNDNPPVSTAATTASTIDTTTSSPTNTSTICDDTSCPHHYCCVQLYKSYTCVSKQFEQECSVELLKDYNWNY